MSVPSVIDFKFAEEESELPDNNIDLEELAPEEEDILEKKEPELIKFEEKEKIVHDEIFDSDSWQPRLEQFHPKS